MDETTARKHTNSLLSLIPGRNVVVQDDIERLLKNVHEDDKIIIRNVVSTMSILRNQANFVHNFEVVPNKKGYDVIGTLAKTFDKELLITAADFEILMSVSPARISTIMVQVSNKALELVVRVFFHDTPLTFSTVQVSHISKKTRFW
ncbi:hypothetical protein T484DRAFT_1754199 [Baffinella frigidus]|nr:hypothetical protein T484DRAFT_1754199 [Cryptophyta sp. CCMP2293]